MQDSPLNLNEVYIIEDIELGRGAIGIAYQAIGIKCKKVYAAKTLQKNVKDWEYEYQLDDFKEEIQKQKFLMHTNIANFINCGIYEKNNENKFYCIIEKGQNVMEYFLDQKALRTLRGQLNINKDELKLIIEEQKRKKIFEQKETLELMIQNKQFIFVDEKQVQKVVYYLAQGFRNLDRNHVCHQDFKLDNFIITQKGIAKIIDFGMSHQVKRLSMDQTVINDGKGSPAFMAPEVFYIAVCKEYQHTYNRKCDIFSLGVSIYKLLYGLYPFGVLTRYNLEKRYKDNQNVEFTDNDNISKDAQELLQMMLKINANERCTFDQFFNHRWVKAGQPSVSHMFKQDLVNFCSELTNQYQFFIKNILIFENCQKYIPNYILKLVLTLMTEKIQKILKQEFELFPPTNPPKFKFKKLIPAGQLLMLKETQKQLKSLLQIQNQPQNDQISQKCIYLQNKCLLNCLDHKIDQQAEKLRSFFDKHLQTNPEDLTQSTQNIQSQFSSMNPQMIQSILDILFTNNNQDGSQNYLNEKIKQKLTDKLNEIFNDNREKFDLKAVLEESKKFVQLQHENLCLLQSLKENLKKDDNNLPSNENDKEVLLFKVLKELNTNRNIQQEDEKDFKKLLIELCQQFCQIRIGKKIKWQNFAENWGSEWDFNWENEYKDLDLYYQSNNLSKVVFAQVLVNQNHEMENMEFQIREIIQELKQNLN